MSLLLRLAGLLAPPACAACGAPPHRGDDPLCPPCRAALPWLAGPCPRCALPRPCGRPCPAATAAFTAAWAPVAHAGSARALVLALKFRGSGSAADVMAAQMAAGLPRSLVDGAALVPVPMPAVRRRVRGVDHADRLAAALAGRLDRPVARCLHRRALAQRQVGTRGAARRAAAADVRAAGPVPPVALLVDDVHTTGATLHACAAALRRAGTRQVAAVTYARALPRRAG